MLRRLTINIWLYSLGLAGRLRPPTERGLWSTQDSAVPEAEKRINHRKNCH